MSLAALCENCDKIDFKAAGFHSPGDEDYNFFALDEILLAQIVQNAPSCIFCQRMSSFILAWLRARYGSFEDLSIFEGSVEVRSYRTESIRELNSAVNKNGLPSLFKISATFTIVDPISHELIEPSWDLQKCALYPAVVESLFSLESCEWPDAGERYLGRIRPLQADIRLFRKWKDSCLNRHGEDCERRITTPPDSLRVIDVQQSCLVDVAEGMEWIALSYCWGEVAVFTLQKHNLKELYIPGSFRKIQVSKVVQDAMTVTAGVGERYLWVDSLCIVQDDLLEKERVIPLMSEIYSASIFTIVDAAGADSQHGLAGISAGSRTIQQEVFVVKGTPLMEVLDPINIFLVSGIVGESKWNSRAWTFQEGLLPSRLLIFTPEQAYWQCSRAAWCEDGCWEYFDGDVVYRHSHSNEFRQLWSSADDVGRLYRRLVEWYSKRAMSHASDGLNAISGILRTIQVRYGLDFIWGLPSKWLGAALTWAAYSDKVIRRSATVPLRLVGIDPGSPILHCPFPSWSWVGWEGKIIYERYFVSLESRHAGLVFHILDRTGVTHVVEQHTAFKEKYAPESIADQRRREALAGCPAWRDDSRTEITSKDPPSVIFTNNLWAVTLAFWTSVMDIEVSQARRRLGTALKVFHDGKELDVSWAQEPKLETSGGRKAFSLLIIGRETVSQGFGKDRLVAVVSEPSRGDDALFERCGAVTIAEEDWTALQDRVWKMVFMI